MCDILLSAGTERRVSLSSIKAPRLGTRSRPHEAFAWEAREFLRRRLIGTPVHLHSSPTCSHSHSRKHEAKYTANRPRHASWHTSAMLLLLFPSSWCQITEKQLLVFGGLTVGDWCCRQGGPSVAGVQPQDSAGRRC